eukprot:TRINITY_DN35915_c0_g1_i1.p1 TRINITY_DN35915_c0_g1~~TRINITY_DN35915_c0_g1_i1.p1  ORF type:complete len:614 (+),score=97.03 TRINITY_DN35915_c0_g1_i1:70-1911(+)
MYVAFTAGPLQRASASASTASYPSSRPRAHVRPAPSTSYLGTSTFAALGALGALRGARHKQAAQQRGAQVASLASISAAWGFQTTYSQAAVRIPPDSGCPDGAVCLPEGQCQMTPYNDEQLTKMICTLGPASSSPETLRALMEAGMDVARLNFSHGDHESQLKLLTSVREVAEDMAKSGLGYRPVAVMLDTKGPEIRTGMTKDKEKVVYERGSEITLTSDYSLLADEKTLPLSYAGFVEKVAVGQAIRVGDGALNLEVTNIDEAASGRVTAKVLNEAAIGPRKNCNIPGVKVDLPLLQQKDEKDLLEFALPHELDFIALSFVQDAESVEGVRKLLAEHCKPNQSPPLLISKIENGEGLKNFDAILEASDGIMVARGDLGMEIPPEQVFMAQKVMIGRCNLAGKFVITATQMLESMTGSPRPTRAEASDVANAVLDGTDCVMLSGETAAGLFPVEAASMMTRICREAERSTDHVQNYQRVANATEGRLKNANEGVCHAACRLALDCNATAILALTTSGYTARQLAKYKPSVPIIAITPACVVRRQLAVVRGVVGLQSPLPFEGNTTIPIIRASLEEAQDAGLVVKGDSVVVVHGNPEDADRDGFSNLVKVIQVE